MPTDPSAAAMRPLPWATPTRRVRSSGGWWQHASSAMGTAITLELWSDDKALAAQAVEAVMRVMRHVDETMSPYKADSQLSLINRDAARREVPVGDELFAVLRRALQFSALTGGAFDISYAAAGHLYDYRAGIAPDDDALAAALPGIGWRHIVLDDAQRTVRFTHPATRIDLGGFAKGHAIDEAARQLLELGVAHAYLSAGGDSRVIGDRRGRPWSLGIRDPRAADEVIAILPLEDVSVSTSGDYERCFVRGGQRVHHLIDPATGRPARGARSVTVLATDGLAAEALSKTVFVLGPQRGLALVARMPGADAVVVDAEGQLHCTPGLQQGTPAPAARA